ncbi:MAG: guanylate kinase [Rickettsiaceae bacterium]|nr:guanylate kinase [Rickettsiaceae bacterium]
MSNSNFNIYNSIMIISGPSGSGKSTLCNKILNKDANIVKSISYTTRSIRKGEVNGEDYYFISNDEFEDLISKNQMVEYTKIYDHYYGTPLRFIEESFAQGRDIIFDIESQGAKFIMNKFPKESFGVFILPSSIQDLEDRLVKRARDSEQEIATRLHNARNEINQIEFYNYIIVNEDLNKSSEDVLSILRAERLRRVKIMNLKKLINLY